jgi:hypothetical protein
MSLCVHFYWCPLSQLIVPYGHFSFWTFLSANVCAHFVFTIQASFGHAHVKLNSALKSQPMLDENHGLNLHEEKSVRLDAAKSMKMSHLAKLYLL